MKSICSFVVVEEVKVELQGRKQVSRPSSDEGVARGWKRTASSGRRRSWTTLGDTAGRVWLLDPDVNWILVRKAKMARW
jgi:hypothetical protein